ncbi:MAG: thiol-disulfide isomerase/thioredoxin [Pseudohongiellaceae bacterium]
MEPIGSNTSGMPTLLFVSALLIMSTSCSPSSEPNAGAHDAPGAVSEPHPADAGQSSPATGLWTAWLDSPGGELAFHIDLVYDAEIWRADLLNGNERISIPSTSVDGSTVTFDIGHYDSQLTATVSDDGRALDGEWLKRRGPEQYTHMGFHARAGAGDRATFNADSGPGAQLTGRWKAQFESDDQPAAALFSVDDAGHLSGTFITTTGDYRYLAGDRQLDIPPEDQPDDGSERFTLSCFDGAHAFLFKMRLHDDGLLTGDFWSRESWHETWTAQRAPDFTMPDGFALTQFIEDADLGTLAFPDLDGVPRTLDDPDFAGKARVIQIFGSWCPNCHDACELMAEFADTYGDRGLSILGLAFEVTGDHARDAEQVRRYAARHGVPYPLLIAGLSDKDAASESLPFLDKVRSYPTTVFLHSDGRVRAVYQGFSGPATGADHQALRAAFSGLIEELLGE